MKTGAMTVPKLVAMILGVVILIVLIVNAGNIPPFVKQIGDKYDNVLYSFGIGKNESVRGGCENLLISSSYGAEGEKFLEDFGIPRGEYKNNFLFVCDDGACGINLSSGGKYRLESGMLESLEGKDNWVLKEQYKFKRDAKMTKKDWEIYNGFLDLAEDRLGEKWLKDFYNGMYTDRFILYGDGFLSFGKKIYMYWQNGVWESDYDGHPIYADGDYVYFGDNEVKAINTFALIVSRKEEEQSWWDRFKNLDWVIFPDDVYFRTERDYRRNKDPKYNFLEKDTLLGSSPAEEYKGVLKSGITPGEIHWRPIYFLVGYGGRNNKLDRVSEITKLRKEFVKRKENFLEDSYPSEEDLNKFKDALADETITVGGEEYTIDVEWDFSTSLGHYPLIKLTNGVEVVELKFNHQAEFINSHDGEYLRDYPLVIQYPSGIIANEKDYKLIESSFDKSYKLNLIGEFIISRCG